jgi:hypothetical protein
MMTIMDGDEAWVGDEGWIWGSGGMDGWRKLEVMVWGLIGGVEGSGS